MWDPNECVAHPDTESPSRDAGRRARGTGRRDEAPERDEEPGAPGRRGGGGWAGEPGPGSAGASPALNVA